MVVFALDLVVFALVVGVVFFFCVAFWVVFFWGLLSSALGVGFSGEAITVLTLIDWVVVVVVLSYVIWWVHTISYYYCIQYTIF